MNHFRSPFSSSALLSALALFITGCATSRSYDVPAPIATSPTVQVALISANGQPAGKAVLRQLPGSAGVDISIEVQDMAPGLHGFHIHTEGSCVPGPDATTGKTVAFGAAGGHFDPFVTKNHGRPAQSAHEAHAGEAPNIRVGTDRQGSLRFTSSQVTLLPGKTSVMGRALVVHESEDDYASDPAGNSGARIACGVIQPATPGAM